MEKEIKFYQLQEIENKFNITFQTRLNLGKNEIKKIILSSMQEKIKCQKILNKFSSIFSMLQGICTQKLKAYIERYESILKANEQSIRNLYKNIFSYQVTEYLLESKIRTLLVKEKEFEFIKRKIGVFTENGKIQFYRQKDNEILILRQENSNLKTIIEKYEKTIEEMDYLYKKLIEKYEHLEMNIMNKSYAERKILLRPNYNTNINNYSTCSPYLSNITQLNPKEIGQNNKDNYNYKKISKRLASDENVKSLFSLKKNNNKYKMNVQNNHRKKFNLLKIFSSSSLTDRTKLNEIVKSSNSSFDKVVLNYCSKNYFSPQKSSCTATERGEKKKIQKSYFNPTSKERDKLNRILIKVNNKYNQYKLIHSKPAKTAKNSKEKSNKNYKNSNFTRLYLSPKCRK